MSFTYDIEIPAEDGKGTEKVTLVFKDIVDMPIGVLRRNRHDPMGHLWSTVEWGLGDEQVGLLDRLPSSSDTKLLDIVAAWREDSEDDDAEDDDVKPKTRTKKPAAVQDSTD